MAMAPALTGRGRAPVPPVTGANRVTAPLAVAAGGAEAPATAVIPVPGETDAAMGRVMVPGPVTVGAMAAALGMTPSSAVSFPAL